LQEKCNGDDNDVCAFNHIRARVMIFGMKSIGNVGYNILFYAFALGLLWHGLDIIVFAEVFDFRREPL